MKGKRGYIIGLSIVLLIFGIWVIQNFKHRYANDELVDEDKVSGLKNTPQSQQNEEGSEEVGYVILNDEKTKAPDFNFINQNKDSISQKDYDGKVYVVEFFYTSCPTICPIMNKNLVEVSDEFEDNDKFGIASFSIDPEHDTPEVLKEYREDHNITHPHWNFLTGDQDNLYELAENGFKLNAQEDPNEPGGIMHDGMFVLIDKEGYIRSRKDQYGNPILFYRGFIERDATPQTGQEEPQIDELIEDIKFLLNE